MDRKAITIKKYENRRLYDTTNSRYINLEEVAELIKDGFEVKVVDADSGEDITRVVLTQIIMENAKSPGSAFPLDVLKQMIMASGKATQKGALQYMKAMVDMYQGAYRALPLSPFQFLPGPVSRTREGSAAAAPPAQARRTEVDELRQRVEELEAIVSQRSSRKKARKVGRNSKRRRSG